MAQQTILGTDFVGVGGKDKINNNFTELYTDKQNILSEGAFVDGDKTKLDGIETGAEVNTVTSVNGRTGIVTGLAEVSDIPDNTDYVDLTTAQTIAGDKTFSGILKRTESKYSITATSGTIDLNYNNGTYQEVTLTGTTTFTLSNPNRNFLTLKITNGGVQTITWPTVNWAGGEAPVLTDTGTDIVSFYYDGTDYYGDYQTAFATV